MKIYKISFVLLVAFALFGCNQVTNLVQQQPSPTQTMKNFVEATQKKDPEGMKKALSASTVTMMENLAGLQGKTLDETIKEGDATGYEKMPEMRNEKIEGDTAMLEVKNDKSAEWETLYFVKENNDWKIALDKTFQEAMKKGFRDLGAPDTSNSNSSTTGEDNSSTDKKP